MWGTVAAKKNAATFFLKLRAGNWHEIISQTIPKGFSGICEVENVWAFVFSGVVVVAGGHWVCCGRDFTRARR